MFSCHSESFNEEAWKQGVESWHQDRIDNLTQDDSWLSLAGLYWLEEGHNSFGSDPDNDIVFEYEFIPNHLGVFILEGNEVRVELEPASGVKIDGVLSDKATVYLDNHQEGEIELSLEHLSWYIIERSGHFAVRLKDHKHPNLLEFSGIERFPVSTEWKVEADFIQFDSPLPMTIPDYSGIPREENILGVLEFDLQGERHRLYPVADNLEDRFFVIFADETNGQTTYNAGRFVYTDPPDENNRVIIDFNRSYNPPCVFSPYATCPLPPPENRLSAYVYAGELNYEPGY